VNLCGVEIPRENKLLLQLGKKFDLLWREQDKEKTIIEFIKHIEKNIFMCHKQIGSSLETKQFPLLIDYWVVPLKVILIKCYYIG